MIPKIIHSCWFGKNQPTGRIKSCKASWRRHLKDYELLEWNDSNTDMSHPFLQAAFERKYYSFVSDFIRIAKLRELGGVYLDTDMYLVKQIPRFLHEQEAFLGVESNSSLSAGVIGSVPNSLFINRLSDVYNNLTFNDPLLVQIPRLMNLTFTEIKFPVSMPFNFPWGLVLPSDFFYPLPYKLKDFHWSRFTTPNTIAIHLWEGSWLSKTKPSLLKIVSTNFKYQLSRWYVPESFISYARNV